MKDLIPVTTSDFDQGQVLTVDARALHAALEVKTRFSDWIQRRITEHCFTQNVDFMVLKNEYGGNTNLFSNIEYTLTIRMAKHIAMMERTPIGEVVRDYFIACEERALNIVQAPMSDDELISKALIVASSKLKTLEAKAAKQAEVIEAQASKIEADKPKVEWASVAERAETNILIGTYARLLSATFGIVIGQNRLFALLREHEFLCAHGKRRNEPTQMALDLGVLTFKESPIETEHGVLLKMTPLVTPKGQEYFIDKIRSWLGLPAALIKTRAHNPNRGLLKFNA